jgi:hypothetical protein
MIHPHTEIKFINEKIGYGIVATKLIPKGTITWVLDKLDRFFTREQIKSMDPLYQEVLDKYTYRNAEGNYILCWDNARFVNHSSNSNCLTTAYEFEIAVRDIQPGEELTDDYGYLNVEEPFEAEPEKGVRRKTVYPDDTVRYHHDWDAKLLTAMENFRKVEQPLIHLLGDALRNKVNDIAIGKDKMDSILHCYYGLNQLNGKAYKYLKKRHPNVTYPI